MTNEANKPDKTPKPNSEANGKTGWGKENYVYPVGVAHIEVDEMKCVGCGICQMACSMKHFGVINKDLSRMQIRKYLLPLPKAVQVTCVQCMEEERECEKACPASAITYDKKTSHMKIDTEKCLGNSCLQCQEACSAKAVRSNPLETEYPFVCDLCDTENTGNRKPHCVDVCPASALYFVGSAERFGYSYQDITRIHADKKADLIAKRLYPLKKKDLGNPGWR